MSVQPKAGEILVGAFLKLVAECEVVAYGQHSPIEGDQMEVDVVGLQPTGRDEIVVCEVATHLRGLGYGTARENRDTVERKFTNAVAYARRAFPDVDTVRFQFWSPVVQPKSARLLQEMTSDFRTDTGRDLELVINEDYAANLEELRAIAAATPAQRGELGFRFLQILEHVQE